jgi:hypothetical protein
MKTSDRVLERPPRRRSFCFGAVSKFGYKSNGNGEEDPAATSRSEYSGGSLSKFSTIVTAVFISIALTSIADAKHRHTFDRHVKASRVIDANGNVVGRRPARVSASFLGRLSRCRGRSAIQHPPREMRG